MTFRVLAAGVFALALGACAHTSSSSVARIPARAETPPVGIAGDAADDPAIWVTPNPDHTRVIGTQKKGGYYVYDLDGRVVQELLLGRPNNVDLVDGFAWRDGAAPLVVASDRADNTIPLFRLDPASGRMETTPRARIATGFAEVYGVCVGKRGAETLVVATSKIGEVGVWRISPVGDGATGEKIAAFALGSIAEGCVLDGANNAYYVSQELVGLWRVGFEDAAGASKTLVDKVGAGGGLIADVEGVTLWDGAGGAGYLIVSVQGRSVYNVYDRAPPHAFRGAFRIGHGPGGDEVSGTDGIAVSSAPLGPNYPRGLFVAQDDVNTDPAATQNFKYASWADIAAALKLD